MENTYLFGFATMCDEDGDDFNFFYIISKDYWDKYKSFKKYRATPKEIKIIQDTLSFCIEDEGIYSELSEEFDLNSKKGIEYTKQFIESKGFVYSEEIMKYAKNNILFIL